MKCPICEQAIKKENINQYFSDHILLEEYIKCSDENHFYYSGFTHGKTEIQVGSVVFHSNYSDTDKERNLKSKQYRAVLELEKEYYKSKIGSDGDA